MVEIDIGPIVGEQEYSQTCYSERLILKVPIYSEVRMWPTLIS